MQNGLYGLGKGQKKEVIILSEYDLSMGCQQTT